MEVSSHAASQHRIAGLHFTGGVFTNITHDHLDYHKDFSEYLQAKQSFFDSLPKTAFALVNGDDRNGMVMVQHSAANKYRFSLRSMADFQGKVMELHVEGMRMQVNDLEVWVRLTGRFNASNILAVYGTSILLGQNARETMEKLSRVGPAEGRFEMITKASGATAIIDYAHTDDALKNVLETVHEVNAGGREIITVIGAGGDRDKSKRPKMGKVSARMSDKVILTSDNPRSENPEVIMLEMQAGVESKDAGKVLKITNREEAIKTACMMAGTSGLILVAGKGHEKYQEIAGERIHFDDKELVIKYLKE
jgi:UDP-N-acetylmuramoyl-L-alanyl-D-glutamate--2,6-diaminopimelate ligase